MKRSGDLAHASDGHGSHSAHFMSREAVARVEDEGDVYSTFVASSVATAERLLGLDRSAIERVVDLGCGPGVSTCQLAEIFPEAAVVAADGSPSMLDRVIDRATARGLDGRVTTCNVDLAGDLVLPGLFDLAFASMSLHHVENEVTALRHVRAALQEDGVLIVLERADPPELRLDRNGGCTGLWERLVAAQGEWFEQKRAQFPGATTTDRYPEMLAMAGLHLESDEVVQIDVDIDAGGRIARRYVIAQLEHLSRSLGGHAEAADLDALAQVVRAASSPEERLSGTLTATRRTFIARAATA